MHPPTQAGGVLALFCKNTWHTAGTIGRLLASMQVGRLSCGMLHRPTARRMVRYSCTSGPSPIPDVDSCGLVATAQCDV